MKWIIKILIVLLALILGVIIFVYFKANASAPEYDGDLEIKNISAEVSVSFDEYGIPHIQAKNKKDLYTAFGFIHAQDRLFQMELLRRAGGGRLAEIIGEPMIKVDKIFHTIGLPDYARESANNFEKLKGQAIYDDAMAYLDGINQFIALNKFPPEYSLIGFEPKPFTLEDMFCITGAMSFSFSQAQKTEPVISAIYEKYGSKHLADMGLWHGKAESFIPNMNKPADKVHAALGKGFDDVFSALPFSPLEGSNAWVLSGEKTESGKVMFCNDTHIGYLIPQTWYEAYLTCPDFELYGHFMAAVPFALVGRSSQLSWGLTMLLNDDMDFYYEKIEGEKVLYKGERVPLQYREATIKVKDQADIYLKIPITPHGPIVNGAFDAMTEEMQPISMQWTYTIVPNKTVEAFYGMNNSKTIEEFEQHLPKIHAPGLSVNYGDASGNIAWWACAQLVKRPKDVNSWTILDGASGENDWLGYYHFTENPHQINPSQHFIYSANDWPGVMIVKDTLQQTLDSIWYPGYYKPQYRGDRITKVLSNTARWSMEDMKTLMTDITSDADADLLWTFKAILREKTQLNDEAFTKYYDLWEWNGEYKRDAYHPTFFNKMLYHYLHETMVDELGEDMFQLLLSTHQIQRTQAILINNKESAWWDNVNTKDSVETREQIIRKAFEKSISELTDQFGANPKIWTWRKACTLELKHPLGEVAALRPIFNVGPHPVDGGNETVMQSGFLLNPTGEYKVYFGSQMRIIVDFERPDSALNITPCGQSGHIMSKHYSDQNETYINKTFRIQTMGKKSFETKDVLILRPA